MSVLMCFQLCMYMCVTCVVVSGCVCVCVCARARALQKLTTHIGPIQ